MLIFLKLALSWDVTAEIHGYHGHCHMYLCTGWWCWEDAHQEIVSLLSTSCLCDLGHVTYSSYGIIWLLKHIKQPVSLWKRVNCDPEQNPSSFTSAFKTELFLFLLLTYSNTVPHCIRSVLLCFFVYGNMWKKTSFCCLLWEDIFTHKPGSHAYFI